MSFSNIKQYEENEQNINYPKYPDSIIFNFELSAIKDFKNKNCIVFWDCHDFTILHKFIIETNTSYSTRRAYKTEISNKSFISFFPSGKLISIDNNSCDMSILLSDNRLIIDNISKEENYILLKDTKVYFSNNEQYLKYYLFDLKNQTLVPKGFTVTTSSPGTVFKSVAAQNASFWICSTIDNLINITEINTANFIVNNSVISFADSKYKFGFYVRTLFVKDNILYINLRPLNAIKGSNDAGKNTIFVIDTIKKEIIYKIKANNKYSASLSRTFIYNDNIYFLFTSSGFTDGTKKNYIYLFDLENNTLSYTGKSFDFWYSDDIFIAGSNLFLFNTFNATEYSYISYNIDSNDKVLGSIRMQDIISLE